MRMATPKRMVESRNIDAINALPLDLILELNLHYCNHVLVARMVIVNELRIILQVTAIS